MKSIKKSLKINSEGSLVEWNDYLKRWELVYRSWSWNDIDSDFLEESKENYQRNIQE